MTLGPAATQNFHGERDNLENSRGRLPPTAGQLTPADVAAVVAPCLLTASMLAPANDRPLAVVLHSWESISREAGERLLWKGRPLRQRRLAGSARAAGPSALLGA
jgi:hypothetical protein